MPPSKPQDGREFVRMSVALPRHPKLLDTKDMPRCGWLFTCGVMYAREQRTDGILNASGIARVAGVPVRLVDELVRVGLWHKQGHDCGRCVQPPTSHVVVHDYGEHNQSKAEIEAASAAARAAADARWNGKGRKPKPPAPDAGRNAKTHADRISGSHSGPQSDPYAEVEAEAEKNPLLTYVGRLAGGDARDADGLPAEVIAAWQDRAGPDVDLVAEARAYLAWAGDRPARNPRAAWLGWLDKARERAAAAWAAERRLAECREPDCRGGWLPGEDDRPRPCPSCKPHIRPAEEAS